MFGSVPTSSDKVVVVNFLFFQVVRSLISSTFSAFCFSLILVHSLQCDTFSSVVAELHKLLRLNKTSWKLPTCQADCKVVFSWTRTSTPLMLFPVETVLLQCHGRSGRWCPLQRQQLKSQALCQQKNVNQQQSEHSRIGICFSTVTFSGQIHTRKLPLTLCRLRRQCRYLRLQIWPRGSESTLLDVVFSCGSAHGLCGLVIWWHLIILQVFLYGVLYNA